MLILPAVSLTNLFGLPEALFTLVVACCSSSEKSDSKLLRSKSLFIAGSLSSISYHQINLTYQQHRINQKCVIVFTSHTEVKIQKFNNVRKSTKVRNLE